MTVNADGYARREPTLATLRLVCHVGSTSVPGLAAKPVIDIDVVIPTRAEAPAVIAKELTLIRRQIAKLLRCYFRERARNRFL